MESKPLVSICIPVYNAVNYIDNTIQGFLNQTYKRIEIIVSDDCSTDGTWEKLLAYNQESKIRLYRKVKNSGIGPNWNEAYRHASGRYVVIANADDIHDRNFVLKAVKYIENNNVDFVSFKYHVLHEKDNSKYECGFIQESGIINGFQNLSSIHIIYTLFKRELIEKCKINGNAFMNTQVCDFEFLQRYSYYYPKLYYSSESIGYYRIHNTNNSKIPLGELKSYYYDVLPYWFEKVRDYEKEHYPNKSYLKKRRKAFMRYNKSIIKKKQPLDFTLYFTILKFYLKSW